MFQVNSRGASAPFVTFRSPTLSPGTYGVNVRFKKSFNAGIFTLGVGSSASSVSTLGERDGYRSPNAWSEQTLGTLTVSSSGRRFFRFTMNSKNISSSGFWLYLDAIRLVTTN